MNSSPWWTQGLAPSHLPMVRLRVGATGSRKIDQRCPRQVIDFG
jgi:hypothetical protein